MARLGRRGSGSSFLMKSEENFIMNIPCRTEKIEGLSAELRRNIEIAVRIGSHKRSQQKH